MYVLLQFLASSSLKIYDKMDQPGWIHARRMRNVAEKEESDEVQNRVGGTR